MIYDKQIYENKIMTSNSSGDFIILEYIDSYNVIIKFLQTGTIITAELGNLKKGSVKDPYYPSVYNTGYFGVGQYSSRDKNGKQTRCYKIWKEMIGRCYCPKVSEYNNYGGNGVTVCKEWLNFQNFADWYYNNCYNESFVIDKDFLVKGNKIYSPNYCCFIPKEINTAITWRFQCRGNTPIGVRIKNNKIIAQINYMNKKKHIGTFSTIEEAFRAYKKEKETCLKEYANKYKNILPKQVYNAIYNYKILITD